MRGALVLLGALPILVATLAIGWLALLSHRDALDSLEQAEAVQRFEIVTNVVAEFDSELGSLQAWSQGGALQAEGSTGILGVGVTAVASSSDAAWDELSAAATELDPLLVERLGAVLATIEGYRSDFAAGEPAAVAATAPESRAELRDLTAELNSAMLREIGASGPVLTMLVGLAANLTDESVVLTGAMVAGIGSEDQRQAVLLAGDRSDRSFEQVDQTLSGAVRDRFADVADSEARAGWEALRERAIGLDPDEAAMQAPSDVVAGILGGVRLIVEVDEFRAEVFDSIAVDARTDGADALRRRNLIVAVGVVVLVGAILSALLVGRRLARRIMTVAGVAAQVSAGELDIEPLEVDGNDEVSHLADAMDDLVATLRSANAQIDALAAGRTDDPSLREDLPGTIGRSLRIAIGRLGRSTQELQRQATHDSLTGLLDRHGLDLIVETWDAGRSADVGVIMLDLDGFKSINDELGHPAGDAVLRLVAVRLGSIARSTDVVARLGGDEFVVLLAPGADAAVTEQVSHRLVELICQPITVEGEVVRVGASVGWVVAAPDTPTSVALRQADAAMYAAKRSGKGRAVEAQLI